MSADAKSNSGAASHRPARILVVEDNDVLRTAITTALRDQWASVTEVSDGQRAIEMITDAEHESFDVVLCEMRLPGADGTLVQCAVQQRTPEAAFLLMTENSSANGAIAAMQRGVFDFIAKPFDLRELELRVRRAVEHRQHPDASTDSPCQVSGLKDDFIVADSEAMRNAVATAKRVAGIRSTVLLTGETGTGKEVIAGLIHAHSPGAARPFIKVNCAALPETLLESELFGHERGAFTGADHRRIGRFEQANGGTLLLDEIAETSPATQAKLLRVLQDQEFYRLGGTSAQRTSARIIAATNRNLDRALHDGSLREDLYYRINVIEIHLPPLRERREDISALAERYRERFSLELDRLCTGFTSAALRYMKTHSWPGNVRELRNVVERAVLLSDGSQIDLADVRLESSAPLRRDGEWQIQMPPAGLSLHTVERALVLAALRRTGFVQKDAAQLIGVSKRKLNYMIQRMGLVHQSWRRNRVDSDPGSTSKRGTSR